MNYVNHIHRLLDTVDDFKKDSSSCITHIETISSTSRCYYVGMKVKKYGRLYFEYLLLVDQCIFFLLNRLKVALG